MAYFIPSKAMGSLLYIPPYKQRMSLHPVHLILAWILHLEPLILRGRHMSLMMHFMRENLFHKVPLHPIPKVDTCPFACLKSFMTSLQNIINTFLSWMENLKTVQLRNIYRNLSTFFIFLR